MSEICRLGFYQEFRKLMLVALLATAVLQPAPASACDTGHHNDMTRAALQRSRFNDTSIKVVQLENWLVDYYAQYPSIIRDLTIRRKIREQMERLHFDNIFTLNSLQSYWARLTMNTRGAVRKAIADQDVLQFLTVIGQSLHAVQDFYVHSNWVEKHPRASGQPYRTDTWFNTSVEGLDLYTGAYPDARRGSKELHGGYNSGLNKDSYARQFDPSTSNKRLWDEAYVFAYVASCEWMNAIQQWAEQSKGDSKFDIWERARTYELTTKLKKELELDLTASYKLSLYIEADEHDGHWKGGGSGSDERFGRTVAEWQSPWFGKGNSPFVDKVIDDYKNNCFILSSALYEGSLPLPSQVPQIPPLALQETAIMIRTLRVNQVDQSRPDRRKHFYARIKVESNDPFVEAVQRDWKGRQLAWATIQFVPSTTEEVSISYSLWAENERMRGADLLGGLIRQIVDDTNEDINPLPSKDKKPNRNLDFIFNITTGECTGLGPPLSPCGTESTPFTLQWPSTSGRNPDGARASVSFFVTSIPLVPRQ
jgi:hypothetical protein